MRLRLWHQHLAHTDMTRTLTASDRTLRLETRPYPLIRRAAGHSEAPESRHAALTTPVLTHGIQRALPANTQTTHGQACQSLAQRFVLLDEREFFQARPVLVLVVLELVATPGKDRSRPHVTVHNAAQPPPVRRVAVSSKDGCASPQPRSDTIAGVVRQVKRVLVGLLALEQQFLRSTRVRVDAEATANRSRHRCAVRRNINTSAPSSTPSQRPCWSQRPSW